jgi:hypothetical protein
MFPLHQSIKSEVSEHCFIMRFGGRPFNMEGVSMFFPKPEIVMTRNKNIFVCIIG